MRAPEITGSAIAPFAVSLAALLSGGFPIPVSAEDDVTALEETLRATEIAFAATMARRDHAAFAEFLSDDAIFLGSREPLRGKDAVVEGWAGYFEGEEAPFSWEPELVVVVGSGDLGLTAGPVRNAGGDRIGGFQSVWRREGDAWRIVLDRSCD